MGDVISAAGRFRGAARIFSPASHKFAVGASVVYRMGHQSEKCFFASCDICLTAGKGYNID